MEWQTRLKELHLEPSQSRRTCLGESQINELESLLGTALPDAYKEFLRRTGGACVSPVELDFFAGDIVTCADTFYGDDPEGHDDLLEMRETYKGHIPPELLPVAGDGMGGQICLGISGDGFGQVFFWDDKDEPDDGAHSWDNIYLVAEDFATFIEHLEIEGVETTERMVGQPT